MQQSLAEIRIQLLDCLSLALCKFVGQSPCICVSVFCILYLLIAPITALACMSSQSSVNPPMPSSHNKNYIIIYYIIYYFFACVGIISIDSTESLRSYHCDLFHLTLNLCESQKQTDKHQVFSI